MLSTPKLLALHSFLSPATSEESLCPCLLLSECKVRCYYLSVPKTNTLLHSPGQNATTAKFSKFSGSINSVNPIPSHRWCHEWNLRQGGGAGVRGWDHTDHANEHLGGQWHSYQLFLSSLKCPPKHRPCCPEVSWGTNEERTGELEKPQ